MKKGGGVNSASLLIFGYVFLACFYFYYSNLGLAAWTWFTTLFSVLIHWFMREIVVAGG
jgi:hypothetical protein